MHNKKIKHRCMPAAFRWTRSYVARRLQKRQIPERRKSKELIMSIRFKRSEPSFSFKKDFETVVI